jgi:hypothetical protein
MKNTIRSKSVVVKNVLINRESDYKMVELLESYWLVIIVAIIACIYIVYLVVNKRWNKLRTIANKLMLQAEQTIVGTKKGRERFEQVLTQVYLLIPIWIRIFLPKSAFEKKLQQWFELIKDSLDDGKINNSVEKKGNSVEESVEEESVEEKSIEEEIFIEE